MVLLNISGQWKETMLLNHSGKPDSWDNHLIVLINKLALKSSFQQDTVLSLFLPLLHELIGEPVNFRTLKINNLIVLIVLGQYSQQRN